MISAGSSQAEDPPGSDGPLVAPPVGELIGGAGDFGALGGAGAEALGATVAGAPALTRCFPLDEELPAFALAGFGQTFTRTH